MCGIVGTISQPFEPDVFATMTQQLHYRGPDDAGVYMDDVIHFGHRRLSILDIEGGHQPMFSPDKEVVIIFNGEIYNFIELRNELLTKGITFESHSDTEVLIQGYLHYGIEGLLERIEGMFAFALHDFRTRETYVARDRFGEKPLYYMEQGERFVFASELKALSPLLQGKKIDKKGLNLFLSLTYIPAPFTIYEEVKKMMPGTYFRVSGKGVVLQKKKYYDLGARLAAQKPYRNFEEAKQAVSDLLSTSVQQRMIADVPIGAFLSGGIDSSIVSILMAEFTKEPINTFSIGFKEKVYDESERAQLVADQIGSRHFTKTVQSEDLLAVIDEVIDYYDEPYGDSSAVPAYFLAQLASKEVKVVLTGDCADELFGGYEKYLASYYTQRYNKLPAFIRSGFNYLVSKVPFNRYTNVWVRKIKKVINNANLTSFDLHYQLMCLGFQDEDRKGLLKADFYSDTRTAIEEIYFKAPGKMELDKSAFTDIHILLEGDMLAKVDRICMRHSLEARVPFLDTQLVEAAFRVPAGFKIKGRNKKYILKEAFKNILNPKTIKFRKKGFGSPVDVWFKDYLQNELRQVLNPDLLKKQGIFNVDLVQRLIEEHLNGIENHKSKLWNLFVFQKWYNKQHLEA